MNKIEWDDSYAIGIEMIDHQHERIIFLANLFFETAESESNQGLGIAFLAGIITYVKSHHVTEEEEMAKIAYPELDSHRQQHKQLVLQLKELLKQWYISESIEKLYLIPLLRRWISDHILNEDRKFSDYFYAQNLVPV